MKYDNVTLNVTFAAPSPRRVSAGHGSRCRRNRRRACSPPVNGANSSWAARICLILVIEASASAWEGVGGDDIAGSVPLSLLCSPVSMLESVKPPNADSDNQSVK